MASIYIVIGLLSNLIHCLKIELNTLEHFKGWYYYYGNELRSLKKLRRTLFIFCS